MLLLSGESADVVMQKPRLRTVVRMTINTFRAKLLLSSTTGEQRMAFRPFVNKCERL